MCTVLDMHIELKGYEHFGCPVRVIYDSPDKTGKTEMARELSRLTRAPYFKNRNEFGAFMSMDSEYFVSTLIYAEPFFCDFIEQSKGSFIMDRGFASEFVYSKAFDRESNDDWIRRVDEMYARLGTKIIIPLRSSYIGRSDPESQGKIDDKMMALLDSLYRQFSEWTKCECLVMNVDDEDLQREMDETIRFLRGMP